LEESVTGEDYDNDDNNDGNGDDDNNVTYFGL
jgi:hypothetical protein